MAVPPSKVAGAQRAAAQGKPFLTIFSPFLWFGGGVYGPGALTCSGWPLRPIVASGIWTSGIDHMRDQTGRDSPTMNRYILTHHAPLLVGLNIL